MMIEKLFKLLSLGIIQFLFYIEEKSTAHIIYLDEVQELFVLADGAQESEMSSNHYFYVRPRTLMGAGLYFMEDILLSSVKKKWDQLTRTIATVIDAASATPFWNKAMISRANTVSKQNSDDNISCRTMLTQISCSSIPTISPSSGKGQSVKHKCTMLLSQLYITRKTMKQTKANRKRLKPGENPRPRPKDS
ncbi:hypothetical protein CUMW_216750 [Citrus unshiu]|uniref:Uncharacterized protein n=1 Tax=Citrus unshiu TaxID=55188 RepID=A0A2H5QDJ6_CITUN|nr:hypothetical protein CUMW_216750 [Citrus unshiu]